VNNRVLRWTAVCWLLLPLAALCGVSLEVMPLQAAPAGNYTQLTPSDDIAPVFDGIFGSPAIPLQTLWLELPAGEKLADVTVTATGVKPQALDAPPVPQQQPVPLSMLEGAGFADAAYTGVQPKTWLHGWGWGRLGGHNVAWVSLYTAQWDATAKRLLVPQTFEVQTRTDPDPDWRSRPETESTAQAMRSIGLRAPRTTGRPGWLLIAPQAWVDEYAPLTDWRRRQGYTMYFRSLEDIAATCPGPDLATRVRACITEYYEQHDVAYVTLGADDVFLPARRLFAFSCQYGLYDDEDYLPADLYYAGLDGNWNDDGDTLWGEDDDDPDWLPEVTVGRIPATNGAQVTHYVRRLLDYEAGTLPNYRRALGLCMDLWTGAGSQACQQFIYDMYFPAGWSINFLHGAADTHDNAMAGFAQNPNIVQHTGHAGFSLLSLTSGRLNLGDMNNLGNTYGGMMYSIGCLSAALDRTSVGETSVVADSGGMLAYIGNSRYGWGAPGAAAFGFSEFFQKECFRLLFREHVLQPAVLNAQQKLPFVPYYPGTSVYKWCAYELNDLGDAAFRLIVEPPDTLAVTIGAQSDTLFVQVHGAAGAVEDAAVTIGAAQAFTNAQGCAWLPDAGSLTGLLTVWKTGYRVVRQADFDAGQYVAPFLAQGSVSPQSLAQGGAVVAYVTLHNPTAESLAYTLTAQSPDSLLEVISEPVSGTIEAGGCIALPALQARLRSIDESGQLEDGSAVSLWLRLTSNGAELCALPLTCTVLAPQLTIGAANAEWQDDNAITLTVVLANTGSLPIGQVHGAWSTTSQWISVPQFDINTTLQPEQMAQVRLAVTVASGAPEGHIAALTLNLSGYCNDQGYQYTQALNLPLAQLAYLADFETDPGWQAHSTWQRVTTAAYDGQYSLSCRPDTTGCYNTVTPWFPWMPGAEVSFDYYYRMPMYGVDGVFFLCEHGDTVDTLLFLGAGGALPRRSNIVYEYIESDWAHYSLLLEQVTAELPQSGDLVRFVLRFRMGEVIAGLNEYASTPDIGVFIDNFAYTADSFVSTQDDPQPSSRLACATFPNPAGRSLPTVRFSLPQAAHCTLDVYNIRGQRVRRLRSERLGQGEHEVRWNLRDDAGRAVADGVYLLRLNAGGTQLSRKLLIIR